LKVFCTTVGTLMVFAAIVFSNIGYRYFVILGAPIAISAFFGIDYVLYEWQKIDWASK